MFKFHFLDIFKKVLHALEIKRHVVVGGFYKNFCINSDLQKLQRKQVGTGVEVQTVCTVLFEWHK